MGRGTMNAFLFHKLFFQTEFFFALKTCYSAYYFNSTASVREMFSSLIYRRRNAGAEKFK